MPEYLAPGVYVEEVSYRASTIEGVPTSTTGFAGLAPFGPVYYPGGPSTCEPLLVTSFPEFELAYGKLDQIFVGGEWRLPYLAHAARAFFLNGGQLLYISRVFKPNLRRHRAGGRVGLVRGADADSFLRDLAGALARQHGQRRHHHDRDPQPGRRRRTPGQLSRSRTRPRPAPSSRWCPPPARCPRPRLRSATTRSGSSR